jgi:hypothetical protein
LYRFYGYLEANADDSFDVTLIDTAGLVMDTLKSPVGISEDSGHMNIISTIYALTAMPSGTTDPLNTDSIATLSDSAKLKLLITAMVDLSLAHNSPKPDENEQSQGIFTNYMQFMDNVVGKWDSIRSKTQGISRLKAMHDLILDQNKSNINDPVVVENYGTSFEPTQIVQERKNFIYTIGFSRINWEIEKPDYKTSLSGTGLLFRISDNIAVYHAKTSEGLPVFDTLPFLSGDFGRRFIFRMNNTVINTMVNDSDGVWIRALSDTCSEQFFIGIVPVRLPIKLKGDRSPVKIDTAFSLQGEDKKSNGRDPIGTILKDAEKNLLKIYVLDENKGRTDTIKNATNPNMILHGQKRRIEVESSYFCGERIKFSLQTSDVDRNKMYFTDSSKYSLTMVDTSYFVQPWTLLALAVVSRKGKEKVSGTIAAEGHNGIVCLKDANNGNQYVWVGESDTFSIAVGTDSKSWIKAGNDAYVNVITTKGTARIYKHKTCTEDDEIMIMMWNEFKDIILSKDSIYVVCKEPGESVIEISLCGKGVKNPVRERLFINRVSLKLYDTLGRDLSIQANAFSPKRIITEFDSKIYDTARIGLNGLIFPEAQDAVTNVKIEFIYDSTNSDHVQFYGGRTGSNRVLRTLHASNITRSDNISVKWDGRDSIDNRVLLGGQYSVIITANTEKNNEFKVSNQFIMANPSLLSFGINYPLREVVQDEINMYLDYDRRDKLNWNAVPFLNYPRYRDFLWLGNFALAMKLSNDIDGYDTKMLQDYTHSEVMLEELNNSSAVFRFMGHHTLNDHSGVTIGNTLFNDERLLAYCNEECDICTDTYNTHCINRKCDGNERNVRYLDDVLFAALIGCRTGVGDHSTAQALIDQGVDCVLATKLKVPASFMTFFNTFLWTRLNKGETVENAAADAYRDAINSMIQFTKMSNEAELFEAFRDKTTNERLLDIYANTIIIFNDKSIKLLPARYGTNE